MPRKSVEEIPKSGAEARRRYARQMLEALLDEPSLPPETWPQKFLSGFRWIGWLDRRMPLRRLAEDPYWYRIKYILAADSAHRQLDAWYREDTNVADAFGIDGLQSATDLAVKIETELARPARNLEHQYHLKFLQDIEPSGLILWAGIVTLLRRQVPPAAPPKQAEMSTLKREPEVALRKTLEGEIRKTERSESGSASPPDVMYVIRVVENRLRLSARGRYNLACYYGVAAMLAHRQQDADAERRFSSAAITQLDLAAPGLSVSTIAWAQHDPSLRQLTKGHFQKEFREALARHDAPAAG